MLHMLMRMRSNCWHNTTVRFVYVPQPRATLVMALLLMLNCWRLAYPWPLGQIAIRDWTPLRSYVGPNILHVCATSVAVCFFPMNWPRLAHTCLLLAQGMEHARLVFPLAILFPASQPI